MYIRFCTLLLIGFSYLSHCQISDFKSVDFTKADNIAKHNKGATLANLPLLAYNLTHKLSSKPEKFRAIYIWVCHNIKGDYAQQNKVINKRRKFKEDSTALKNWNNEYKKKAFRTLLKHKKTICTGYAYLIKELCYLADIESVIVNGYGRAVDSNIKALDMVNHSWNAVNLNNKWYLCDATWSSGYINETGNFIQDYNNGYFLTAPNLFGKNHLPLQQHWLLNTNITASMFVKSPLLYGETFKHNIIPITPQKMDLSVKKNGNVSFKFKTINSTLNQNITLVHYIGTKEIKLQIHFIKSENNSTSFYTKFKIRGIYDVHLKINNDIVATYTVTVTKN